MKRKADWTREDYAEQIALRRRRAAEFRTNAEQQDREADELSRETAKFNTLELPILNPEEKPCRLTRKQN